jgi:hypothetical protein
MTAASPRASRSLTKNVPACPIPRLVPSRGW